MKMLAILAVIEIVTFAYMLQFSQSTRHFGLTLSESKTGSGLQDVITPPWQTNLARIAYAGWPLLAVSNWLKAGWVWGVGAFVAIFIGASLLRKIMPRADSVHFRNCIIRSMLSRYADFVRKGDSIRAQMMGDLLTRAGFSPDVMIG
jgi:hypothetical protein